MPIYREKKFYSRAFGMAVPLGIQNLVINGLTIMSTFMLGFLGENYLAGITLATTFFFIADLIVFGLCSGGSILIAQYHGKGDKTSINRILGLCFGFVFTINLSVATVLTLFPTAIYSITSNDAGLIAIASEFGRVAAFSLVFNALSSAYIKIRNSGYGK